MRERLSFLLLVVVVVAAVPLVYWLLFERELAVSEPEDSRPRYPEDLKVRPLPPDTVMVPAALSVSEVEGRVQRSRGGGRWQDVEVGTILLTEDRIRTGKRARAVLVKPGVFTVELDSASEFEVGTLSERVSRFLLQRGMIQAQVVPHELRDFEVDAEGVRATTRSGTFRMGRDENGVVSVGTKEGRVEVAAAGKVVTVEPGYVTRVNRGAQPADPIAVPPRLFLKVRWPRQRQLAHRNLLVAGRTEKGSRVRVNGEVVLVDSRGRFRKMVVLKEGSNQVKIEAYDTGWRRRVQVSPPILVDTRPDAFHINTSPKMWRSRKNRGKNTVPPGVGKSSSGD